MNSAAKSSGAGWALFFAALGAFVGFLLAAPLLPVSSAAPGADRERKALSSEPPEVAAKPARKTSVPSAPKTKPVRPPYQENPFDYNYALAEHGAKATGGKRPELLIDGKTTTSYAYTSWKLSTYRTFVVTLEKPVKLNLVRFLLYDRSKRFYRYKLEASAEINGNSWFTLSDRSQPPHECQSWQEIAFEPRVIARLRLTGTWCSKSNSVHVVEMGAYHVDQGQDPHSAHNYALAEHGAKIAGGKKAERVIDGSTSTYGYTIWKMSTTADFVITFEKPVAINVVRFLLYDRSTRYYRYKLEASAETDGDDWFMLADRSEPPTECRSWQVIAFKPRVIARLRLTGTYSSSSSAFHVIELEAYNVPGGLDYPWMEWEF